MVAKRAELAAKQKRRQAQNIQRTSERMQHKDSFELIATNLKLETG
jgi:hypothetical protein